MRPRRRVWLESRERARRPRAGPAKPRAPRGSRKREPSEPPFAVWPGRAERWVRPRHAHGASAPDGTRAPEPPPTNTSKNALDRDRDRRRGPASGQFPLVGPLPQFLCRLLLMRSQFGEQGTTGRGRLCRPATPVGRTGSTDRWNCRAPLPSRARVPPSAERIQTHQRNTLRGGARW